MADTKLKDKIPLCSILGVKIAAVNMEWVISFLEEHISELKGEYICVSNVHTTVTSYRNADYCAVQNDGIMALPDGGPLSYVGRKRGYKIERVAGPDLMSEIFEHSRENNFRHFFYGSMPETMEKMKEKLEQRYPGIQIVGEYCPPFCDLSTEDDEKIVKIINQTRPDFVSVGLGAPKQERWMAKHKGKVQGLMIGVGAGFDYFAGNIKRAPIWMQKACLEWLYRLLQEPKRLFLRYFQTNFLFIVYIWRENRKLKKQTRLNGDEQNLNGNSYI